MTQAGRIRPSGTAGATLGALTLLASGLFLYGESLSLEAAFVMLLAAGVAMVALTSPTSFKRVGEKANVALLGLYSSLFWLSTTAILDELSAGPEFRRTVHAAMTVTVLLAGLACFGAERIARYAAIGMLLAQLTLSALVAASGDYLVDVQVFQSMGAEAVLSGSNPYSLRFPDIYPPEASDRFYGPGISVDGQLTRGFPYPPATLLPVLPAAALDFDVRWIHRLAITATGAILLGLDGLSRRARLACSALMLGPGAVWVSVGGWTEVFLGVGLAATALLWKRRWLGAFMATGFLALKQYTVLFLPLLPLLWPKGEARRSIVRLTVAGAPWLVLTVFYAAWSVRDFVDAAVTWQLVQPFRPDSLSLLAATVNRFGWPGPESFGIIPFAAGFGTSFLLLAKAPRRMASWAGSVGTVLLMFVLFSKQAFPNYYYLVAAAFCVWLAADDQIDSELPFSVPRRPVSAPV